MDIGKIIAKLRTEKGLNQRGLAKILGVSNGAIGMWETGKRQPDLDTVKKIASFFGVTVDYLISDFQNLSEYPINSQQTKYQPLAYWINHSKYENRELAKKLGISQELLEIYISGSITPPYDILIGLSDICKVSTDCLLGLYPKSRPVDQHNVLPFRYNYEIATRIRTLCDKKGITQEHLQHILSLSEDEVYRLIEYGFVPHMDTIIKLAAVFKVSCDYLLCQIDEQEEKATMTFRLLDEDNKDIIVAEMKKALRAQKYEETLSSNTSLKEAK